MAHFRNFFPQITHELSPMFRMLDDFDRLAQATPTFKPRFDVKELKDSYELHGELPGIDQKNVSIEWQDASTITISGRTETRVEKGTPPVGSIEAPASKSSDSATEAESSEKAPEHHYHKPSVIEIKEDGEKWTNVEDPETSAPDANNQVATSATETDSQVAKQGQSTPPAAPEAVYWVSERSVGEFRRAFTFPARVDHENVKASLKNGILSVVVPKAKITGKRTVKIE